MSKEGIRLSVVIPCFNQGEFLSEAIASVENCKDGPYEIIIVDDGSTDSSTREIINGLEKNYLLVRQENRGPGGARNAGIKVAKGEYILPLDADNKIRPNYIYKGIRTLDRFSEIGVVYGNAQFFGGRKGIWKIQEFSLPRLILGNYIDNCAVFRKRVWEDCGGYDENMPFNGWEDWDFWLSVAEKGWKFFHIDEILYDYRVRPHSLATLAKDPNVRERLLRYVSLKHLNLIRNELSRLSLLEKSLEGSVPNKIYKWLKRSHLIPSFWRKF